MMHIPLPKDLEDALLELKECGDCIDDDQYTAEERANMLKLKQLGLATISWRLTENGKQRLKAIKE